MKQLILGYLYLKVRSASIAVFRISEAIRPHFVWEPSKITIFHTRFLIFSDFSMLSISLNSVKSAWQQRHLFPESERIFYCFSSYIPANNTLKYLNGITVKENSFSHFFTFYFISVSLINLNAFFIVKFVSTPSD